MAANTTKSYSAGAGRKMQSRKTVARELIERFVKLVTTFCRIFLRCLAIAQYGYNFQQSESAELCNEIITFAMDVFDGIDRKRILYLLAAYNLAKY